MAAAAAARRRREEGGAGRKATARWRLGEVGGEAAARGATEREVPAARRGGGSEAR